MLEKQNHINESIVLVGGGGGVYRVARFLKHVRPNITTIQTVFDHGGHSGGLRDERGVLPPGDIRQAILALSDDNMEPALRKLMNHRFAPSGNSSLNHATVGNILLTALTEIEGSLPKAVSDLCKLCGVKGRVLPVSLDDSELCAELSDNSVFKGEGNIDSRPIEDERIINKVFLEPKAHIFVDTYEAICKADKIVFCPGDLYTSLIPNLLVDGFKEALKESSAKLIYCVNIMNKKSETYEFSVSDFVEKIESYLGKSLDFVVYNNGAIEEKILLEYAKEKSVPVHFEQKKVDKNNYISADLVSIAGGIVRHHERIASIIADI